MLAFGKLWPYDQSLKHGLAALCSLGEEGKKDGDAAIKHTAVRIDSGMT